jgi:hypothetical protein
MAKRVLKALLRGIFLLAAFLPAVVSGFGRWEVPYGFFAHAFALVPGIIGGYLRVAFYRLTLAECSLGAEGGSFSFVTVGANSWIGAAAAAQPPCASPSHQDLGQ